MRAFRGIVFGFVVVLASLISVVPALAQPPSDTSTAPASPAKAAPAHGIGFGVLGGAGFTTLSGDGAQGTSSGTGPIFGVWFGGNRNGHVGFMGELSYVEKKITITDSGPDSSLSTKYIELPALVRINVGSKSLSGVSVYGLVGPVFDFRTSSTLKFNGVEQPQAQLDNQFSSVDIGILAGGGIEFARFAFEVRGNWGMKQLATDEAIASGDLPKTKSTSIQVLGKFRIH